MVPKLKKTDPYNTATFLTILTLQPHHCISSSPPFSVSASHWCFQASSAGMRCVLQDFEIAGSRTDALSEAAGPTPPAASTDCEGGRCECDSPPLDDGTPNSWDSHSHYRRRPASPDLSLYSGVVVYCDHTQLKSATGLCRLLLLVSMSARN